MDSAKLTNITRENQHPQEKHHDHDIKNEDVDLNLKQIWCEIEEEDKNMKLDPIYMY